MKTSRQEMILSIVERENIETQNQLMEALAREGVKSTQATLSRDIRDLHLVKELTAEGTYRYVAGGKDGAFDHDTRLRKIFRECVVDYAVAQNIVVIKTLPGLANAACSTLDSMSIPHLVGTIAGDDTAFLAMRDVQKAVDFCREIEAML